LFTGIIEDFGRVSKAGKTGLELATGLGGLKTGDSISVNGVCLTITEVRDGSLTADVSPETFRHTNLGKLKPGNRVNLERAMKSDSRLGGHVVTGHVEQTGTIKAIKNEKNSKIFEFSCPKVLDRYIVKKGSIAIDGISLTVAEVKNPGIFTAAVIPHTLENTTLNMKKPGETVNIETDIMAKYSEKLLDKKEKKAGISREFLARAGFIK